MNDERLRTITSLTTFLILIIMAIYLYRNVEYLKRDPCDACEKGTGFRCVNYGNTIIYNQNGTIYRPQSQPNAAFLSNSTLCKTVYTQDLSNLSLIFGK